MKFFIILIFITSFIYANHVVWYGDFDKAHNEALKSGKNLMVFLITKDCKECKNSLKSTFMNKPYIDVINNNFISVIVTKGQKQSYPIEMLYTFTYPTLFFLDNKELFICEPIRGKITPNKLETYLKLCN